MANLMRIVSVLLFSIVLSICILRSNAIADDGNRMGKPHPANVLLANEKEIHSAGGNSVTSGITPNLYTMPYTTGFESPSERDGWSTVGDFGLGTVGGKLGGPKDGSSYFVTRPGLSGSGTSDNAISMLYSPYFDLTGQSSGRISFFQSIVTHAELDRSIVQYTLDTGRSWLTLGHVDDQNGINWYSTCLYHNATLGPSCWISPSDTSLQNAFSASWTSNGDCSDTIPGTGPFGYVWVAYNFDGLAPNVNPLGHNFVQFRYVSYCRGGGHADGWAIDRFTLADPFIGAPPGDYSGKIYNDLEANGIFDGTDTGLANAVVTLMYYGCAMRSTVTDGSGNYVFINAISVPGMYNAIAHYPHGAISQSSEPADGSYFGSSGNNVGYYVGNISGRIFNDINNNGNDDAEPGVLGARVQVFKDSADAPLVAEIQTDSAGHYLQPVLPGSYVVQYENDIQVRKTFPHGSYNVSVSGLGGSPTALRNGIDFGLFRLGTMVVSATVDKNGDGIFNSGDTVGLQAPATEAFVLSKEGVPLRTDTIGLGGKFYSIHNLDTGAYVIALCAGSPPQAGYALTSVSSRAVTIATSGVNDTTRFLWFSYASVQGQVFNDLNGNGVRDPGDADLSGWYVSLDDSVVDTTNVDGSYMFDGLSPGNHSIRLINRLGFDQTTPAGSLYTFAPTSGQNLIGKNFGVFGLFSISGTVYRDRDKSGSLNSGDVPLADNLVTLSRNDSAFVPMATDSSGNFTFSNLHSGHYTLTSVTPTGYEATEPESTLSYSFDGYSGAILSGNNFGFFRLSDTSQYRTITPQDIAGISPKLKPSKNVRKDTLANLTNILTSALPGAHVGIVGTKKAGWMRPKSYKDIEKSLIPLHAGTPSGFDSTAKNRPMKMGYMSIPPKVQDNVLFMNLLALSINLSASDVHVTPAGLGDLRIADGGLFDGMTIRSFMDSANNAMTFWKGISSPKFDAMNDLADSINNAFHVAFDYDSGYFRLSGKMFMKGFKSAYQTGFLLPATSITPAGRFVQSQSGVAPSVFGLYQNYPNPFNPTTTIRLDIPGASIVTVIVFNVLGQQIAVLLDRERLDAGVIELPFDASRLASGVYFYKAIAQSLESGTGGDVGNYSRMMRMIVLK